MILNKDVLMRGTIRDKDKNFIMIKMSCHQEDIAITNEYKLRSLKYMKQNLTELKGELDKFAIIVGDLDLPLSN